ncbi:unnamed protein product [Schistocephalus solidus]|uniref:Uncharacterized protein n=1 Tax=Schistocephalus solidus TaxID=70667 RepID=A0A183TFT2_SCHSO|nr:unnamed protein product [Schistocephalus solidus]
MALPLHGIRARCGGTPRGVSGRASHLRPLPPPTELSSHDDRGDASAAAAPEEAVACTRLFQLASLREVGLGEISDVHLVARQFSNDMRLLWIV